MLALIHNVLTDNERKQITDFFHFHRNRTIWIDTAFDNVVFSDFPLKQILDLASSKFDLSGMVGVECWSHFNTGPGWHIDQDDALYHSKAIVNTPICSIVYYASILNLQGGEFTTEKETIVPVTNSILAFPPGINHKVEEFSGERIAIAINPWHYKITL